jgi:hypothetical protein
MIKPQEQIDLNKMTVEELGALGFNIQMKMEALSAQVQLAAQQKQQVVSAINKKLNDARGAADTEDPTEDETIEPEE